MKTSQLQIRVSPDQKAALKRLAADSGLSVSAYVLSVVLPPTHAEFDLHVRALARPQGRAAALSELTAFLELLSPEEFPVAVGEADLTGVPLLAQNQLAACVEAAALRKGLAAPGWTARIDPLDHPYFEWDLPALRPHQMRAAPVPFKRRRLYMTAPQPGSPVTARV